MTDVEPGTGAARWSVDDILADPLGYHRYVDTRVEEDAEAWVEQRLRDLAEARQRPHRGFLARMRSSLSRLSWRRR
ncbi:MAG TPA: hypothetical protein VGW74_05055 [Propionibacteriaceae bacterium]|nr:hypothetical protein [Propionibacteriaceae bacterium]